MVSWADPRVRVPVKRTFTFTNDYSGDTRRLPALNASEAWAALAFQEETVVEDLVERGWIMLFERDGGQAACVADAFRKLYRGVQPLMERA
jgi:hypothetical protein